MDNLKNRITIYEVAKASGVSLATVSRVINNSDNVKPKTRLKVEETIKRLGYRPSGVAKALATNRSTNIGVVIPSANYVYIANMLNGMIEVAKERDYNLTLFVTSNSRKDALKMVEEVITSHVDGAIIFDDQLNEEDIKTIASYSVPSIVINNKVEADNVASIMLSYNKELVEVIRKKINSNNNKPLYFLHVHNSGRLLLEAENAFTKLCDETNTPYEILNVDDSYLKMYSEFSSYFKEKKGGYFIAYRDSLAAAIINAATDNGLKVPEDVEVLSLIGTKYANIVRPTISHMYINMQEVGKNAVYMLNELSDKILKNKCSNVECIYVKKQSTLE